MGCCTWAGMKIKINYILSTTTTNGVSQCMTTGVFSTTLRWNACNDPYPCGPSKKFKKCCGRK